MASSTTEEYNPGANVQPLVKSFCQFFQRFVREKNVDAVHNLYENSFNKLTEKFFKSSRWPELEEVEDFLGEGSLFVGLLYKELYYRHVYARLSATLEDRLGSWETYKELFEWLLVRKRDVDLPADLLWDIVDEFIYQAQAFNSYRLKFRVHSDADKKMLASRPDVWAISSVLDFLRRLVAHSGVESIMGGKDVDAALNALPTGSNAHFYGVLGAFCHVGLLRVHCLLGDYHHALHQVRAFDLRTEGDELFVSSVTPCHISLYYYAGFCQLMMRRHEEALRTFETILLFLRRSKQSITRSYQSEDIHKKQEQIYALLAIIVSLVPRSLETQLAQELQDKQGDALQRLKQGSLSTFEELFGMASPKFVDPVVPADDGTNHHFKAHDLQKRLFLLEVKQLISMPNVRSYLRLYTSITVPKLAQFLGVSEDDARALLFTYKLNAPGDFYMDQDTIHINKDTCTAHSHVDELLAAIKHVSI